MAEISVTHFSDPGCPFAYSSSPAFTVLRWRYGDQLRWRLVTIGLSESPRQYEERGYTPARAALGAMHFRRYGMPFLVAPRERMLATSPAARAIVATRLIQPGREHDAFRALQLAWFNTPLLLDEPQAIGQALATADGLGMSRRSWRRSTTPARLPPTSRTRPRRERPRAGRPTSRAGPVRPTAPSAIRRRRW